MSEIEMLLLAAKTLRERGENDEIALHHHGAEGERAWYAEACNPSRHVTLGESAGEYNGFGPTAQEACRALLGDIAR